MEGMAEYLLGLEGLCGHFFHSREDLIGFPGKVQIVDEYLCKILTNNVKKSLYYESINALKFSKHPHISFQLLS